MIVFGFVLFLAASGCGGATGGEPLVLSGPPIQTVDLSPIGALDGFVDDGGFVATSSLLGGIIVGDNNVDRTAQGFLTFDRSALPAGAEILAATLEIRQYDAQGHPYADLGVVWLDHVELGGTLDGADWGTPALDGNFAVATTDGTPGPVTVDVTDQVTADGHAGRTRTSFRLGFTALTDGDGACDYTVFQDTEDSEGSGVLPRLTVQYR